MNSAPLVELFSSVQGEGPWVGRRQAFLRFHGCNLDCTYCDTVLPAPPRCCRVEDPPGSGRFREIANPVTLADVAAVVAGWCDRSPGLYHSLSITGGEPLLYADLLARWLPELRKILPLYLETNGTLPEELAKIAGCLDFVSMDIKLPSAAGTPPLWEVHQRFLETARGAGLFVKAVVGPETTAGEIECAGRLVGGIDPGIPFILQPVTRGGRCAVPAGLLLALQEEAARFLRDVRVIPQTHVFLQLL